MFIAEDTERYYRLSMELFKNLACFDRDIFEQRQRLNPVIDFDHWCLSKLKAPGIKEYHLTVSNGVDKPIIMFQPHNFPNVYYLNLVEIYFIRYTERRDQRLRRTLPCKYVQNLYSEFRETSARQIIAELLTRITEIPRKTSRLMKNLLTFARISGCIRKDEIIFITKSCLNAMYRHEQDCKFHDDENLTVQILRTFCVLQQHKESIVLGNYSYDVMDYVLRCCTAAKFDIEKYFSYDNQGRETHFCPVTSCIVAQRHDIWKLRILLYHGFELQALNLSLLQFIYVFLGMSDHMRTIGWLIADPEFRISDRRRYILLLFLFMVFSSITDKRYEWTEYSKLLFNSIPDPYICELEVRNFLQTPCLGENRISILSLCRMYKGGYTASRTPRTMKHLSRCVVRKVLKNNFQLPNGIDALPLPHTLVPYLKYLED